MIIPTLVVALRRNMHLGNLNHVDVFTLFIEFDLTWGYQSNVEQKLTYFVSEHEEANKGKVGWTFNCSFNGYVALYHIVYLSQRTLIDNLDFQLYLIFNFKIK